MGDVNKITPIDETSTVLTMLLAFFFLGESVNAAMLLGMAAILAGAMLMVEKKSSPLSKSGVSGRQGHRYLLYAVLSAVFASATSILGKLGMEGHSLKLSNSLQNLRGF